jgi:DNA invertase Pin-like site-specific DNA recombinase
VVVIAIDRPGSFAAEVTRTIADLGERRILLRSFREGVDTGSRTGPVVATIMATLISNSNAVVSVAPHCVSPNESANSGYKPAKLTPERQGQLRRLAGPGEPVQELAQALRISRATAYRYLAILSSASGVA